MKMDAISLRLNPETLKKLREIQQKMGMPVSEFIRRAIEHKLRTICHTK